MKKILLLLLLAIPLVLQAQVGIGTPTPNAQLEIKSSSETTPAITDGLLIPKVNNFPATNPTVAQQGMLVYLKNASGFDLPGFYYWNFATLDWIPINTGSTSGTLDQAYDFGGAGLGKTITADAGAVLINGTDGLVATGLPNIGALAPTGSGVRMVWNPRKAAFRSGRVFSTAWDDTNIGLFSTAFGENPTASGLSSIAVGFNTVASGNQSQAFGSSSTASGAISTVFGANSVASGDFSAAFGYMNTALGNFSTVWGQFNHANTISETVLGIGATKGPINLTPQIGLGAPTDRLFVIGNAIDINGTNLIEDSERRDAMIVLKSGLTRLPSTTNAMISASDGKAVVTKEYLLTTTFGTLDQAYDFGGPGNGKTITADNGSVLINGTDGLVSTGTFGVGSSAPAGAGVKMVWNPKTASFRAGRPLGNQWNDANIGDVSVAFGISTTASGDLSTAFGDTTLASGLGSTAFGRSTTASGFGATSFGFSTTASSENSTTFGNTTTASGNSAIAFGRATTASGATSAAFGANAIASGPESTAFGSFTTASGAGSTAFGASTLAAGSNATAYGSATTASGQNATAFGSNTMASAKNSTAFGDNNTAESYSETVLGIGATDYTPSVNGNTQFRVANETDRLFVIGNAIDTNNNNLVEAAERRDAMVVLKNGNIGIGVSAPQQKLHIAGNIRMVDGNQGAGKVLTSDAAGNATWNTFSATNAWGLGGNIGTNPNTNYIGTSDNNHFSIRTGGIERARILNTGDVGIGTITPDRKVEISGTGIQYTRFTNTTAAEVGIEFKRGGGGSDWQMRNDVGEMIFSQSNDDLATLIDVVRIGGGSFTPVTDNAIQLGQSTRRWSLVYAVNGVVQTSDANDKKQMLPLNYGLDKIKNLRPISFQWKDANIDQSATHLGFVAQEVQQILPEVVVDYDWEELPEGKGRVWKKSERLGMKYSEIIPVLVKAVQEQQAIIDKQQTENKNLQTKLESQSKTIAEILQRLKNIESRN